MEAFGASKAKKPDVFRPYIVVEDVDGYKATDHGDTTGEGGC